MIQELTGCGYVKAWRTLMSHNQDVVLAVDALLPTPTTAGNKHMPPPPKIDTGLTPEQEALCLRGRDLQDRVNVVYSVAHSQTRTPLGLSGPETSSVSVPVPPPAPPASPAELTEQSPDSA